MILTTGEAPSTIRPSTALAARSTGESGPARESPASGAPWSNHPRFAGFPPEPKEDASPLVQEIADILHMWSCIEDAFAALAPGEQEAFRRDGNLLPAVFQGFDGRRERDYRSVASFLIEHIGCFARFSGRDLESYHPVAKSYRRLLEAFQPLWEGCGATRALTADELRLILSRP